MSVPPALPAAVRSAGLVAAAAANMAAWHDLHLRALGFATDWQDGLWLTPDRVPGIFFRAIAVRPGASAAVIGVRLSPRGWSSVSDPWSDLALDSLGYTFDGDHPWMVREPGGLGAGARSPARLTVDRVMDATGLADFELVAAAGFGSPVQSPFTWHGPPLLLDPRLGLWRARLEHRTVAVAMSFVEAGVVGVYGVATLPDARRHGYGSAVTAQAILTEPSLPAVLQPSAMAESLYGRLGFRRFGSFRSWGRPDRAADTRG